MTGKRLALWTLLERRVDDMVLAGGDPVVCMAPGTEALRLLGCPIRLDPAVPRGMIYLVDQQARAGVKISGLGPG